MPYGIVRFFVNNLKQCSLFMSGYAEIKDRY